MAKATPKQAAAAAPAQSIPKAISAEEKAAIKNGLDVTGHGRECHRRHGHHHRDWNNWCENTHVRIEVGKGYYPFLFGNAGTNVHFDFHYYSAYPTILSVFDCFCPGDFFQYYDNNIYVGDTSNGVSYCQAFAECFNCEDPDAVPECNDCDIETNPTVCYDHSIGGDSCEYTFCGSTAILLPGYHNISLQTLTSCFSAGTAFIRVDKACVTPDGDWFERCCDLGIGCREEVQDYFDSSYSC